MENVILDEAARQKIIDVQTLIREYLEEKAYTEDDINAQLSEEVKTGLPARQKILLQQMIRERATNDGRDLDELIMEESAKGEGVAQKGQVLGVLSKVEGAYVEILLQERLDRKVKVK